MASSLKVLQGNNQLHLNMCSKLHERVGSYYVDCVGSEEAVPPIDT